MRLVTHDALVARYSDTVIVIETRGLFFSGEHFTWLASSVEGKELEVQQKGAWLGADLRAARRELSCQPGTGRLGDPALPTRLILSASTSSS